ncbi:MAG: hypothetical protein EOM48_07215 [Bacilli bacterium]|nr:hypothetical protein [Bacilli bacterium]
MGTTTNKQWWRSEPWRLIQTNLRQIDMQEISATEYVKSLKEFDATVAMINTGGILASYDTKVDSHFRSEYLTGDSLATIIDACHREDIRVIARMDFSKAVRKVYVKHPDWAYRDLDGDIIDYNGFVHMCITGGFQQSKAFEIVEETIRTLPVDGIFVNMGGFQTSDYSYRDYGLCHCENCTRRFKEMFNLDIPEKVDLDDIAYRKYLIFQKKIMTETKIRMNERIKSIKPEVAVDGFDFFRLESSSEYRNTYPAWQYNSSSLPRGARCLTPERVCTGAVDDFLGFFYRHISPGAELQKLRFHQNIANYGSLDYYIIGMLDNHQDASSHQVARDAFAYMKKNDERYRGLTVKGDVLLFREGKHTPPEEARGWIRVLTENHILFEEASTDMLDNLIDLSRFKCVILTNNRDISDKVASFFDEYVCNGGCLIITGETGRFDQNGKERKALPFKSMGIKKITERRHDMVSAMFAVSEKEHKAFPSLKDTKLVYFGEDYTYADYDDQVQKYLSLIPPHYFGPPEVCYYTVTTDNPGMTVNRYGAGKAIYIPWLPGALFHHEGIPNTALFLKDVLFGSAELESVESEHFSPMVEVTYGSNVDRTRAMIHLINGTGHFGKSFYEPVPIDNINLKFQMEKPPVSFEIVTEGSEADYSWKSGYLYLHVKRLEDFFCADFQLVKSF